MTMTGTDSGWSSLREEEAALEEEGQGLEEEGEEDLQQGGVSTGSR